MKFENIFSLLVVVALAACTTTPSSTQSIPAPKLPVYHYAKWDRVKPHLMESITQKFNSLEDINAYVNKIPFKSDTENYGVSDYWATPREFFQRGGDCEDYVIAKYALMLQSSLIKPSDAHIVLVQDRYRNATHALLVVRGLVYDNQNGQILSMNDFDVQNRYEFLIEVKK